MNRLTKTKRNEKGEIEYELVGTIEDCIKKLGILEDIEENEVKFDLIKLFQALKGVISYKDWKGEYHLDQVVYGDGCLYPDDMFGQPYLFEDYEKTWWIRNDK